MGGVAPGAFGGTEGLGGGPMLLGGSGLTPPPPVIPPPNIGLDAATLATPPVLQAQAIDPVAVAPPVPPPTAQAADLASMLQRAQDMQRMLPLPQQQAGPANAPPQYPPANQGWKPQNLVLHDYGASKGVDLSKTAPNPYHALVYPDGTIRYRYPDNPYGQPAEHVYRMNPDAIGLSYAGQYGGRPTPEGLAALQKEYDRIQQMFPGIKSMSHGEAFQATRGLPNQASRYGRDLSEASWRSQLVRNQPSVPMPNSPPPLQQFPQVVQGEFPQAAPVPPPAIALAPPPAPPPVSPPVAQRGITSVAGLTPPPVAPQPAASPPGVDRMAYGAGMPVGSMQTALSEALSSGSVANAGRFAAPGIGGTAVAQAPAPIAVRPVRTETIPMGLVPDPGRFASPGMRPTAEAMAARPTQAAGLQTNAPPVVVNKASSSPPQTLADLLKKEEPKKDAFDWKAAGKMMSSLGKPAPIAIPPSIDVPPEPRRASRPPTYNEKRRFRSAFPINEGS